MNIYPYKMGSESATALAASLVCKQIKHEGSKFIGNANKFVINWGASKLPPEVMKCRVLNSAEAVAKASDKLASFYTLDNAGVSIPRFSEDKDDALAWINNGCVVLCRTKLNGHSGEGIVIAETADQLVDAPLYTLYIPKKEEYRVHASAEFGLMFVQRKARRKDIPDDKINWRVRNHDNGFIFAANEGLGEVPEDVIVQGTNAVMALGLDFGAVDIIHNAKYKKAYVLEVNTAPGLAADSAFKYAAIMQQYANGKVNKFDVPNMFLKEQFNFINQAKAIVIDEFQ